MLYCINQLSSTGITDMNCSLRSLSHARILSSLSVRLLPISNIIPQSFQSAFWMLSISLRTYGFCIMLWFSNGNYNDLSSFSGHYLILHHSSMEVFIVL